MSATLFSGSQCIYSPPPSPTFKKEGHPYYMLLHHHHHRKACKEKEEKNVFVVREADLTWSACCVCVELHESLPCCLA